ncbi:chromogranin-A-like [Spea bombifrons]|uniref:chromogranin-A-like n=1 Tax=Spea bombifrons TaxID=233779 RepID=UPI00234BF658|nr:chromogranin-A-like [Spea bombifrons]
MASAAGWLLLAVCVHASAVPLSTQLSEEEEKVTRCIMEVLAESLTVAGAGRVSSHCLRILREDERIVSILRHQHLLRELEGLTHEGETQPGRTESSEEEELRKRDGTAKRGTESEGSRDHQETREFEKIEKVEVKEKEHKESAEEKDSEQLAEGDEDEEKRSPSVKREEKRSSGKGESRRRFSDEDSSEEDQADRGFHGNGHGWHHSDREDWEDKRASQKRMARDPSGDETAQYESENRGLKFFNSKSHTHREAKRHFGPGEPATERHRYNERPGGYGQQEERELEEMEEREERKEEEEDLQELEKELRRAAERLQELRHG